ncbi:MAG: hypothetical protein ACREXR_12340 [Gammaproteobacteria bacterium]
MTAFGDFQNSIAAADQLVAMYAELRRHRNLGRRGQLNANNVDLLWLPRSAVVACLSALDAYIHAVLNERVPIALRANPVPAPLCEAMASILTIKNGNSFKDAMPVLLSNDSMAELSIKLQEKTLAFLSFQAPEKIINAYDLIGHEDIFGKISDIWPGPDTSAESIKRRLAGYVKRRNQIAHEGDRELNGQPRPMQPAYASNCREFTVSLVTRLNRVAYGL